MDIKNHKGMSLIELIIYVGVMTIILLSVVVFLISSQKMGKKNQLINEVEFQGTEIIRAITQTIRNSESIVAPAVGSSSSALSLNTDTAADNPTVIDLSNGKLSIKEGTKAAINLNSDNIQISNLSFKNMANAGTKSIIYIKFDASYVNPNSISELNYQKTFYGSAQER